MYLYRKQSFIDEAVSLLLYLSTRAVIRWIALQIVNVQWCVQSEHKG